MKKSLFLLPVLAVLAATAQAQTPPAPAAAASAPAPEPFPLSANISLTTNYKFRGQDQGDVRHFSPAIQGGFDWSMNGFYLGNWNSNIGFTNAGIEMDFYGGYKGELAKDVGYDVGILHYYYPQRQRSINFNVTELYGALSWQFLSFKYSHTISRDYFGLGEIAQANVPLTYFPKGRNTGYFDLGANYAVSEKLTLNGHAGYTRLASDLRDVQDTGGANIGAPNYWDYKLGMTYDIGSGFSIAGAVVGANKRSFYGDVNKTRGILTFTKTM